MGSAETNPQIWVHHGHLFQELGEAHHRFILVLHHALVVNVPLVGIHVLPQQGHLAVALIKQLLGLPDNALWISASLAASCEGDHAERTHVVAATHDADEGRHSAFVQADRADFCIRFFPGQKDIHSLLTSFHLVHEIGQIAVGVGAHHQVHQLLLFQQLLSQALRHATQHPHDQTWIPLFVALEMNQAPSHTLLRIVSDGTSVQQHQVGIVGVPCRLVAGIRQDAGHNFTVAEIHLAAVALQVQFSSCGARSFHNCCLSLTGLLQGRLSFSHGANVHH